MAILPLRGLGDIGIISDVNPYDLPPNALSMGNNLRFDNKKILRSPSFKSVADTTAATPVFCYTYAVPGASDKVGIIHSTGTSYFFDGSTQDDVTPAVFTPVSGTTPFTQCTLANVSYINRDTDVPQFYLPGSTDYTKLTYWPATYTCRALRAYKSYLIAINVKKAGVENPTMVKWSDIALANAIPTSWDETDPTKSAGENPIQEATSALLDGLALRDTFILYTKDQVHMMDYTADNDVFRFRKVFEGPGIINTNCVVEVAGKHYVFGKKDIYVHDGVSFDSVITGKNWSYVFDNLRNDSSDKFFVTHDIARSEIHFCYVSGDANASFTGTTYCNRIATLNYINGTWAFRDLPNCTAACTAALSYSTLTWATVTATWATIGGSWSDLTDISLKSMYFTSVLDTPNGLTASRLYGYDDYYGGKLSQALTAAANKTSWAERIGIDLDDTGEGIRAYKVIPTIYPQARALGGTGNLTFSFGATEFNDLSPTFSTPVTHNPATSHKVDVSLPSGVLVGGRYLAWRLTNPSIYGHELSGFDANAIITGRR